MKASKEILLTFDFELFLGERSGTVENCLLKPTYKVLEILKKYKMSSIFFVDTLYLHRLKEVAKESDQAKKDYDEIIKLLQLILESGGFVFHHIHPHWLDAEYIPELKEWDLSDHKRFAICNLTNEEIEFVFKCSDEIISEIYQDRAIPPFSGFRAGGLYAQPFDQYKCQMEKYNIRLEMTVVKNSKGESGNGSRKFDFSTFPNEMIYSFSNDLLVKDKNGWFIEIMMDQFRLKGIKKIINGMYFRFNINKESWKRWGDGKNAGNIVRSTKRSNKFLAEETFTIELMNNYKAKLYASHFHKNELTHLISHPKFFSPSNITALDMFLSEITARHKVESDVFKILKNCNNIQL